jgi:amidase
MIPGGSSSGSAVAVATGMADVAFGTDTVGSVRVPAACCGILGLKTTFRLVSLKGVFPLSPHNLDTVAPWPKTFLASCQVWTCYRKGLRHGTRRL